MNEIKMVRDLLGETEPPSERTTAAALRSLESEIEGRRSRRRAGARRFGRSQLGLTGLVAAGAASTVAVATLGGGGVPAGPEVENIPTSPRAVLLAAAEQAAREKPGDYWRYQSIYTQAYGVGKGAGTYSIGTREKFDRWMARSISDPDVVYARDLGSRPMTDKDKVAWKKAGSPEKVRARSGDRQVTISTRPGETAGSMPGETASADWNVSSRISPTQKKKRHKQVKKDCAKAAGERGTAEAEKRRLNCHLGKLTGEWKPELARDPERFKELLFPDGRDKHDPAGSLMGGFTFLTRMPASPEVRAKVFRNLAGISGIRSIGKVTDARGRTGIALSARRPPGVTGASSYDFQLILKPKTYEVLAGRRVVVDPGSKVPDDKVASDAMTALQAGDIYNRELVLKAGWTGDEPHHP